MRAAGAADIVMVKVQPLGGVRAALRVAEACGLPVVVSSAVDTSVGLAAGVALAAALPALPYACGLATMSLLAGDVTAAPLAEAGGELPVRRPSVDEAALARWETDPAPWRSGRWRRRSTWPSPRRRTPVDRRSTPWVGGAPPWITARSATGSRAVTPPGRYREDFFMAKDFCTIRRIILRQEKILRDQGTMTSTQGAFAG